MKHFKENLLKRPKSVIAVILYKGLIGVAESLAGLALVVASILIQNFHAGEFLQRAIARELEVNPNDVFAGWLSLHTIDVLSFISLHTGFLFFVIGVAKLVIVAGVWYRSLMVRNIALVFLVGSVAYGFYTTYVHFSWIKALVLSLDLFFIYYFWRILPKYLKHDVI